MSKIIGVVTSNRAETGLLKPVISRIEYSPKLELRYFDLTGKSFLECYLGMKEELIKEDNDLDIIIIPADRQEMLGAAIACFYTNVPIAHFLAGACGSMIRDEVIRDCISKMSYIMLTQTEDDRQRLIDMGEEEWRVHNVGMTQFDDLDEIIDEDYRPNFSYSMILYHPDTISFSQIYEDLKRIDELIKEIENVFILYPNKDCGDEYIRKWIDDKEGKNGIYIIRNNLPRGQFLCLLKYCDNFIGNSSSIIYEAPFFGTKTTNIGYRNKFRKTPEKIEIGASDRIVKIIEDLDITTDKMRKCYAKKME